MNFKRIMRGVKKYCSNPEFRFICNNYFGLYKNLPDDIFLKRFYKIKTGKELDLLHPTRFNEKLNWLKLYDRNPEYTKMVDKYEAKKYVERTIGGEYVIPTYGIWNHFDEIDFDKLPNQFVLKCTHGCGGMIICRDKKRFDFHNAKRVIEKGLKFNYFYNVREWPYKNVPPRIIAEKYMEDEFSEELSVYKVFNFCGVPKIIQTIQGDKTNHETIDYFDTEWNLLDLKQNYPNSEIPRPRPDALEEMLRLSRVFSKGIPFLRTDWYIIWGKVFFSEFTFYTDAGMEPYHPDDWDIKLGSWLPNPSDFYY